MATADPVVLVDKVFNFVYSNRCFVTFADLRKKSSPLAVKKTPRDVANWIRNHLRCDNRFFVQEQNGKIISVKIASRVRMCFHYVKHGNHRRDSCKFWHVCKDYIEGNCKKSWCGLSHDFHDEDNWRKADELGFATLRNDAIRHIVACNLLRVCAAYVQDSCGDENCPYLHLCADYVRDRCNGLHCRKSHNPRSEHNTSVLKADGFAGMKEIFILCNILLPKEEMNQSDSHSNAPRKPTRRSAAVFNNGPNPQRTDPGHVHEDATVHICSDFILGQCKNGTRCTKHHCSLPYQWQYKNQAGDKKWQTFSEVDNKKIEEFYCEPGTGVNSQLWLHRPLLGATENEILLSFENMYMIGAKTYTPMVELRRLSTESYVNNPGDPLATKWTWYWQDEANAWKTFGIKAETAAQRQIETAFLKQTLRWCEYSTSQHAYVLYFGKYDSMYQKNKRTNTQRKIRRRPELRQEDEIQQLKPGNQGQASFRQPASDKQPGLPSHWTQMSPSGEDFKRVPLSPTSGEFKKVEKRFRETMPQDKTIVRIERVQNPFMWEKFNRKKDKMKTKFHGSNLEKDLFHGTDPDTVENICKENFDWRLYGKNATVYGQGSYFALNASYSDRYAGQADRNSSHFMFLANVLVGSYVKGDSSMRRPPPTNASNPTSDLYDSTVNDMSIPKIFVVFEMDQCYPSYIIEYMAVSQQYNLPGPQRSAVASTNRNPAAMVARTSSPNYTSSGVPSSHSGSLAKTTASLAGYTSSSTSGSSTQNRTSLRPVSQTPTVSSQYSTLGGATASSPGYTSSSASGSSTQKRTSRPVSQTPPIGSQYSNLGGALAFSPGHTSSSASGSSTQKRTSRPVSQTPPIGSQYSNLGGATASSPGYTSSSASGAIGSSNLGVATASSSCYNLSSGSNSILQNTTSTRRSLASYFRSGKPRSATKKKCRIS